MAERVGEVYVDVRARGLQQAQAQIRSFLSGLGSLGAVAGGVMGAQLATAALGQIKALFEQTVQFAREAVEKAGVQERAELQLTQALRLSGQYSEELLENLKEAASAIQSMTTYADEQLLPVMAQFARTGQFSADEIERMTRLTADLAAATGRDLATAQRMVMMAISGSAGQLRRYGIFLDEAILKTKDQAKILEAIERQVRGTAEVLANTWAGKLQQINNLWGDMQERIGATLTKSPEMLRFLDQVKFLMEQIVAAAQKMADEGMWDRLGRMLQHTLGLIVDMAATMARISEVVSAIMMYHPTSRAMISAIYGMSPEEYIRYIRDIADMMEEMRQEFRRFRGEQERQRTMALMEALAGRPAGGPYAPITPTPGVVLPTEEIREAAGAVSDYSREVYRAYENAEKLIRAWREGTVAIQDMGGALDVKDQTERLVRTIQLIPVAVDTSTRETLDAIGEFIDMWAVRLSGGIVRNYETIKAMAYATRDALVSAIEGADDWARSLTRTLAGLAATMIPGVGQFLAPLAGAAAGRLWDWLFGEGLRQEINFRQEIVINIGEGMISEKAFWDNLVHYYMLPSLRRGGMIPEPVGGAG